VSPNYFLYDYSFYLDQNNDGVFSSDEYLNPYYIYDPSHYKYDRTGTLHIPTFASSGYFWLRLIVKNPVDYPFPSTAMDYLVHIIKPCPRETVSGPSHYTAVCEGGSINFEFSPGASNYSMLGPDSFYGDRVSTINNASMLNEGEYNGIYYYETGIEPFGGIYPNGSACRVETYFTVDVVPNQSPVSINVNTNEGTNAMLSASGCTDGYRWYDELTGGKLLGNSAQYITPKLYSNTTYYVSCKYGNVCNLSRIPVTVTVNAPCLSALSISSANYGLDDIVTRKASSSNGLLTATNQITNTARVNYQAKATILSPGFKAQPTAGGYFTAEIGGCN